MQCFPIVKVVLDEIYEQIEGDSNAIKDATIIKKLAYLRRSYEKLLQEGVDIDYTDVITRFAYVYTYVTAHADYVCQLLPLVPDFFKEEQINIACIGGGPGSDLLGIIKHITKQAKSLHLCCTIYDKAVCWGEVWNGLDTKISLPSTLRLSTTFQPLDVFDSYTWHQYNRYKTFDIFTFIYFISEVSNLQKGGIDFFSHIFTKAKPGARFLFIDNNNHHFYEWFDKLAIENNCAILISESNKALFQLDTNEEKRELGEYLDKFTSPKLKANIAYRIYEKK